MTATALDPIQRHEFLTFLLHSSGGRLLDRLAESHYQTLVEEAGRLALDPCSDDSRRDAALRGVRDEAGHLVYLREALGRLASECTPPPS